LIAHLDTVFSQPPRYIYEDTMQQVMWSPDGLGADDRAGVAAIITLIELDLRPSIIFTMEEETTAVGANAIVTDFPQPPANFKCLIELDRQGYNDCVFYNCDNRKFVDYICNFDFVEEYGTFTDISIIAPAWGIAAVNLSIGYLEEHSRTERLLLNSAAHTIAKVEAILKDESMPYFEYVPFVAKPIISEVNYCFHCGKEISADQVHHTFDGMAIDGPYHFCICNKCAQKYIN
jgi:hypothetical protein